MSEVPLEEAFARTASSTAICTYILYLGIGFSH